MIDNNKSGFSAVELMVTLFIAALFLVSGYQLYNLIIKDGGQTRAQARASNVAYDYLQRYKSDPAFIKSTCVAPAIQTPLVNSASIPNLTNINVTVTITCPYGAASSVSKVLVTVTYNNPQQTVSNATYVTSNGLTLSLDAGNRNSMSQNIIPFPTDIFSWISTASNATLSRDTISSPVGNTPMKMVVAGNDPYTLSYNTAAYNLAPTPIGQTWTVSVWAKIDASTAVGAQLLLLGSNSAGTFTEVGVTSITLTTNWQRFSYTYTTSNASTVNIQTRLDGPDSGAAGRTVWWDGLQVEQGSSATPFNSKSANTWTDLSGNNNNGTLMNNIGYTTNNGGALTFNGLNNFVDCGNNSSLNNTNQISINAWVKWPASATKEIIIKSDNTNTSVGPYEFFQNGNNVTFRTEKGGTIIGLTSAASISPNSWANIVAVWNGTTKYIYINGIQDTNTQAQSPPLDTSTGKLVIGAYANSSFPFTGSISNVQLYSRALSPAEVQQNFNNLRGRYGI